MAPPCAVGKRISRNYDFLKSLRYARSNARRLEILENATKDELLAIIEIVMNVAQYKTFCLKSSQRKRMKPYDAYLRKLTRAKSLGTAVQLLQKGQGLSLLPSLLAPVLIEVYRSLFS